MMASFSLSCLVALCFFFLLEPVTKPARSNQTQDCLPVQCWESWENYKNSGNHCRGCTCSITYYDCASCNKGMQCHQSCSINDISIATFTCGSHEHIFPGNNFQCGVTYCDGDYTNCLFSISTCSCNCSEPVLNLNNCFCKIPSQSMFQISTSVYSQPSPSQSAVYTTSTLAPPATLSSLSYSTITTPSTSNNSTGLLNPATVMNSLTYSSITASSTSNLVTVTNSTNTQTVVSVIAAVLPVCLLLLLLLIVIGSILACTLYRRRAKQKTERHQTNTQGQLSTLQRIENTYYAHIPTQSTDGVYSFIHEGNTETSHHNTVLPPPRYSSLATTQPHDVNEQEVPPDYSAITLENILYGVGQSQNPVAPAGVSAGTVYSTVVRQDGEKVTVKMKTSHTHTEEPGVQTAINHDHTSSVKLTNSTSHVTEDEEGAQDMDYFDDPEILQQIRAQK